MNLSPEKFFSQIFSMSEEELLTFVSASQTFTSSEIQNFLDYIVKQAPPLNLGLELFDCCGTGGDHANTFNISTASAITAAAAGAKLCKNGGRSTTSTSGSVDVLEALGLNLEASLETKIKGLNNFNLAFYSSPVSAELLAPIKQICRKHKLTSFLSLLGPLASPVQLYGQVIGCGKEPWLNILTDLQKQLIKQGSRQNALIIHSEFFEDSSKLDELSVCSTSQIIELGRNHQQVFNFDPRDLGLKSELKAEIEAGLDHQTNAKIIRDLLNTQGSTLNARVHTVAFNAAAILYLANKEQSLNYTEFLEKFNRYYNQALEVITSGKALENFNNLVKLYESSPKL